MGNVRSVARAFERVGGKPRLSVDPDEVRSAGRVVVPGAGAAGDAMSALEAAGLAEALRERFRQGRPYLGLCVGLQVLFERTEEGDASCLGLVPGRVTRFPDSLGLAVPHMGWNTIEIEHPHPVVQGGYFYFVHSYHPTDVPEPWVVGTTEYGERFASAVGRDASVAVQFHPEKSQRAGLAMLERYCRWSP
ncbi:MAG: imidazole glycerol phosphate synthase subunit HisH [Deltaproteobacteria bacterium]|nr:imidazole glycerol phosphate synthase subunit HisH [Deltaproteobacteria bacterium]MBW2413575.1 imidazole glycerol phosphate synthase subunit HisH [Deltaproteobacteria bacterium]